MSGAARALEGVVRVGPVESQTIEDDGEAFRRLTAGQLDRAYRLAWAILGDDAEAQDATQDAFAVAWRQRRALRDPARFDAWLGRILVNACRDRLRRRARRSLLPIDRVTLPPVADVVGPASTRDELGRALAGLDPDHRIVVILRYWADLTVDDIADRVGIPPGTVKSRLHHALRALRASLEDEP